MQNVLLICFIVNFGEQFMFLRLIFEIEYSSLIASSKHIPNLLPNVSFLLMNTSNICVLVNMSKNLLKS